jgi:DNA-binding NarL/FixJ family response regulator
MTSFANLAMVSRVSSPNAPTKPRHYDFGIHTEKQLTEFCRQWRLTEEEKTFLRLTELEGYTGNQIAETIGTSRQNISQKRCNLYRRTIKRQKAS